MSLSSRVRLRGGKDFGRAARDEMLSRVVGAETSAYDPRDHAPDSGGSSIITITTEEEGGAEFSGWRVDCDGKLGCSGDVFGQTLFANVVLPLEPEDVDVMFDLPEYDGQGRVVVSFTDIGHHHPRLGRARVRGGLPLEEVVV